MITLEQACELPPLRACAHCEQENGILNRSDSRKSHGHCRRHFVKFLSEEGISGAELADLLTLMSSNAFCPDLAK